MNSGASFFVRNLPALVVASTGRSGSTLVYDALVEAVQRERFGTTAGHRARLVPDVAWSLGEKVFRGGAVYKTHDYPRALAGQNNVKVVFVFDLASEIALSVLKCRETEGDDWISEHLDHLKAPGRFDDILETDILGILPQMRAWTKFTGVPVLCVRYEGIWENLSAIREFTGLSVGLPERRDRTPKRFSDDVLKRVSETYGPIDQRVARLPDVFEAGPEMAARLDEVTVS